MHLANPRVRRCFRKCIRAIRLQRALAGLVGGLVWVVLAYQPVMSAATDRIVGNHPGEYRTIQQAIDAANDGDTVRVRAGTYYETIRIVGKKDLKVQPFGDGQVVIDGAIEALTHIQQGHWKLEGKRYGAFPDREFTVYSYSYPFSSGSCSYDCLGGTIADQAGNLLWTYAGQVPFDLHHVYAKGGEGGYFTAGKVYLSLEGDADPNQKPLYISRNPSVVLVSNSPNLTFDGLQGKLFRLRHGGRYGIVISGSSGVTLRNVEVEEAVNGIYVYGSGQSEVRDVIIENNVVRRGFNPAWGWADVKWCRTGGCQFDREGNETAKTSGLKTMEGAGIALSVFRGRQNIIRNNEVEGYFDGIDIGPYTSPHQEDDLYDTQIYGNRIHNVFDDAISVDNSANNVVVHDNLVYDAFVGASLCPVTRGPVYLYRNVFVADKTYPWNYNFKTGQPDLRTGTPTKFQGHPTYGGISHHARIYFNTFFGVKEALGGMSYSGDYAVEDFLFYNNIFASQGRITNGTGLASNGVDYDNNLFYSYRGIGYASSYNFRGWNSYDTHATTLPDTPASWSGNREADPHFLGGDLHQPELYFQLTAGSPARLQNGMTLRTIPSDWPGTGELNRRESVGAFEGGDQPAPTFADVPPDHPYYREIEALYQAGYTAGCDTDPLRFCPDQAMTRAESAVFVERGVHGVEVQPGQPAGQTFTDLPLESWAAKWAEAMYADGYTAGCGADPLVYCPWQGHTRAEGAVFYLRMLHGADYQPPAAEGIFADAPVEAWYAKWAEAAYGAGLIPACSQPGEPLRFCPDDPLTRGLAASMMVRAKGLSGLQTAPWKDESR